MKMYTIKVCSHDGIWLTGTIEDCLFWAKVCDRESGFGIDDGRVIKLHVRAKKRNRELFSYERGWDRHPKTTEQKNICKAILAFCAALPTQDEWRRTLRSTQTYTVTEEGVVTHDA